MSKFLVCIYGIVGLVLLLLGLFLLEVWDAISIGAGVWGKILMTIFLLILIFSLLAGVFHFREEKKRQRSSSGKPLNG